MANNLRVLDLWFDLMRAELEELTRVPVSAQVVEEISAASSAYRSQLLFEGPVQGVMYVTASASSLVQLSQMVAGEPVDPHAAWTEEGLEVWQIWLTATSGKLATRLSEEMADASQGACTIVLGETTAVDGIELASATETTASGAAMRRCLLRAGESEFSLEGSVQVKFPGDDASEIAVEPALLSTTQAEPVEAEKPELPVSPVEAEVPPPPVSAAPAEIRTAPQPEKEAPTSTPAAPPPDAPRASQTTQEDFAPAANRSSEAPIKQRLDLLLDIELEATLRFGALELPLREVLELGPGDVLPLDRHVRDPVELVVGDRIVAKGEVVLVAGNFALHVTEVAEPRRRLETIRCLF